MKGFLKTIIILAVVIGIGAGVYTFYFKGAAASSDSGLATTAGASMDPVAVAQADAQAATASNEFLTLLLSVQSIKLDDSLFASPAFTTLQDLSRPINPDTNPGRKNPFAPLGADGTAAISTQVTTSNPSAITPTSSTLNGVISIDDPTATHWFEYGTTPSLGTMTTPRSQTNPGAFSEQIKGLLPGTTYYVKAVAMTGGQTIAGAQVTWKTSQATNAH